MIRERGEFKWIALIVLFVIGMGGEVEAALTLSSALSVSETYNDNFFFTKTDREAELTTKIRPSLTLTYGNQNLSLSVGYRGTAELNARHSEEDGYFQSALFDLDLPVLSRQFKRVSVRIVEEVGYRPDLPAYSFTHEVEPSDSGPIADDEERASEGVQSGRTGTFTNRAVILLGYKTSTRLNGSLYYSNTIKRFTGGDPQPVSSLTHGGGLGASYQRSPRTQWSATYGLRYSIYQGDDDVVAHKFKFGAGHQIDHTLLVRGTLGVGWAGNEPPRQIVTLVLTKRSKQTRLSLKYITDIATGVGILSGATHSQRVLGQANRNLGKKAGVYFEMGYGRNESLSDDNLVVSSYTVGTGIRLRLLQWLTGSLGYSYLKQWSSGNAESEGQRNRVVFGVAAVGPSWRTGR